MEQTNDIPTIHFLLPSGGPKGSFQAGFLYRLKSKYNEFFSVYQVDGISIGAINGLSLFSDDIEKLKKTWLSIKSPNDIFTPLSSSPIFNHYLSYIYSFSNMSVFDNISLVNIIKNYNIDKSKMNKYNCVTVDLDKGDCIYINGNHEKIIDYVIASSSPWIVTPPIKIDNTMYTDGGLMEVYPTKNISSSDADIILLVGYDNNYITKEGETGDNIFSYLSRIINISMYNNMQKNINELNMFTETKNVIKVDNVMDVDILHFNDEQLRYGFEQGSIAADDFAEQYLLKIHS